MKRYKQERKSLFDIIGFAFYCLVSLPKTLYFNLKTLPFKKAVRLPVLIGWNVKLFDLKGHCELLGTTSPFMIRIGHGGSKTVSAQRSSIRLRKDARLCFTGKTFLSAGTVLDIGIGGGVSFGNNFSANRNMFLSCENEIVFGNDVLLGWDVHLFDNDGGHAILINGEEKMSEPKIVVGNHVWLCSYSHLMKGAQVMDGSVLGYKSMLLKPILEKNVLIVGSPAQIKQRNIEWEL